jgi:uncharacterized protein (TIGR02996 family)
MSPNSDETALIRSVVAHPDDDAPRLVYADWLDEHGRAARARLIRVQCQLEQLQAEEQELIEKHGQEWGQQLYDQGCDVLRFHRGFPEEVKVSFRDFIQHHNDYNTITPISHLHLHGRLSDRVDDDLAALAQLPAAHQIRSLELLENDGVDPDTPPGPEGMRALADSPYLSQLKKLHLHSPRIGNEGVQVIAQSPTFQNLTHLTLSEPSLTNLPYPQLMGLIRSPNLSKLQSLRLGNWECGSNQLHYFRQSKERENSEGPGR